MSEDAAPPNNRRRVSAAPLKAVPSARRKSEPAGAPKPPRLQRLRRTFALLRERVRGPALLIGRLALMVIAALASVALYRVVDRWVRTAPEFELTAIAVEGEERLEEAELRAIADVRLGDNVFARSPDEMRQSLLGHPWVADAEVTRRLPGTLRIVVREHHPVALLLLDDAYLISDDGIVIKRTEPGDPTDLPLITGVERARFVTDLGFRTQLLASAVALVSEYESAGLMRRATLSEIHVEPSDELTLFVGDEAIEVRLGSGPYRRKLERFARVLDELRREEAHAAYVFLDNVRRPDRVTVRLR